MSYTYGLSILHTHLAIGGSTVLTEDSVISREFWQALKANRPTSFSGVPYTYELLTKLRYLSKLKGLTYITQAGGRLSEELSLKLWHLCDEAGVRFVKMYGQTEATARMSVISHSAILEKPLSIGRPIRGGTFSLVKDRARKDFGVEGEIVYAGANVSLGYADDGADLALGDTNRGQLFTGDLGYFDQDGYWYITGRKKRFLKIHGRRISLDALSGLLAADGYDVVCGGQDDRLVIYTPANDDAERRALMRLVREHTKIHPKAIEVVSVETIPRASNGKVLFSKLNEVVSGA